MAKTKDTQHKKTPKRTAYIVLIGILGTLTFLAGLGSGMLQYSLAAVGCMKSPVAASKFMAGYSYNLPGDAGYGPSPFNEYYCTEQEAGKAGFHRSVLTEAAQNEAKAKEQERQEQQRFSPEKVDFKVYVPVGNGYTIGKMEINSMGSDNSGNRQVFFPIKKGGYVVADAREGKVPNSYELCTGAEDSCEVIGTDASGHPIKKQIANTTIVAYSVTIGDTFINLQGDFSDLSLQDIKTIFSSLREYGSE